MKLKLLITTENDLVVSQEITSESNPKKDGFDFFQKLNEYINQYIILFNSNNTSHVKTLQVFDENDIMITQIDKREESE